jgi:hypothetical protein
MANDIDQIILQAKSQVQNDQILNFIKNNLKLIIATICSIIFLIIASISYNIYQKNKSLKFSKLLHQSYIYKQDFDIENAKKTLELINKSNAKQELKLIAKLKYAAILIDENSFSEAFEIYQNIARCTSCDIFVKELSQLLAIKLWINNQNLHDKNNFIELSYKYYRQAKYLYNNIAEQLAIIEKNNKNWQKSHDLFYKIANDIEAQSEIKQRAQNYLNHINQFIK